MLIDKALDQLGLRPVAARGTSPPSGRAGLRQALHTGASSNGPLPAAVEATTACPISSKDVTAAFAAQQRRQPHCCFRVREPGAEAEGLARDGRRHCRRFVKPGQLQPRFRLAELLLLLARSTSLIKCGPDTCIRARARYARRGARRPRSRDPGGCPAWRGLSGYPCSRVSVTADKETDIVASHDLSFEFWRDHDGVPAAEDLGFAGDVY